jgi:hypothetical protein
LRTRQQIKTGVLGIQCEIKRQVSDFETYFKKKRAYFTYFTLLLSSVIIYGISYNKLRQFPLFSRAAVAERISQLVGHVPLVALGD